jgi:hypothetical protein
MRLLCLVAVEAIVCSFAAGAHADEARADLSDQFHTQASHAELSVFACGLTLTAPIEGQRRPIEIRTFEDGLRLCSTDTEYPDALVVAVHMTSTGDDSSVVLSLVAPEGASSAVVADYRAALRVAKEAVYRLAERLAPVPPPERETTAWSAPPTTPTTTSRLITAGTLMMGLASIPTAIVGGVIAANGTWPGTSPAWAFVPFVGMTVFSATYTEVPDCGCAGARPLSIMLSGILDAVQIAGLVMVLVGSVSTRRTLSARVVMAPGGLVFGGSF